MSRPHPRLFAPEMVRAIIGGRKTQTRRLLTRDNSLVDGTAPSAATWNSMDWSTASVDQKPGNAEQYLQVWTKDGQKRHCVSPRVDVGDYFWGREAWRALPTFDQTKPVLIPQETGIWYEADIKSPGWGGWGKLRPSMFMPYWMSRLNPMPVTQIRPQRLQDISETDAIAEGIVSRNVVMGDARCGTLPVFGLGDDNDYAATATQAYMALWDAINGPGEADKNPLVWAYTFRMITP